jgi:hypothetical protein
MSQFTGGTFGNYSRFWLILTGIILLGVGAVMAISLGGIPFAGGAMLGTGGLMALIGVILIVVGLIVGRNAQKSDLILQTGIPGTATITGLTQTGVYLNENPQINMNLLITLPGEVPYAASHKEFVPLMLLGRLSSGAPLSVRVDQMDRSKIVVDWSGTGFAAASAAPASAAAAAGYPSAAQSNESLAQVQAALAGTGTAAAKPFATADQANYTVEQLRAWLRQNGLQATAHVDKLEDTGKVVGDDRLYTMEMTLNIPGHSPQKLPSSAAMVPVAVSHKVFQGMNVPVRYAAENHDLLMVEWDKI